MGEYRYDLKAWLGLGLRLTVWVTRLDRTDRTA